MAVIFLVGGAIGFFKELEKGPDPREFIAAITVWLVFVAVFITIAEQHDDPWQQYVANGAMAVSSAFAGFLASLTVMGERIDHLKDDIARIEKNIDQCTHKDAFDQFEKRILEKLDRMDERIGNLRT